MNFIQLLYFSVTAKCLNFTEAAQQLYITQPTLSNAITRLESDLGTKLFNRNKRTITLTASGRSLFQYADQILELHDIAYKDVQQIILSGTDILRLGFMNDLLLYFHEKLLIPFVQQHPTIKIRLEQMTGESLDRTLSQKAQDIIINREPVLSTKNRAEYTIKLLKKDKFCLAIATSNPLSKIRIVEDFSIFADENFITMDPAKAERLVERQLKICARRNFYPNISYTHLMDAVLVQVACGMGISIVPEILAYKNLVDNITYLEIKPSDDLEDNIIAAWRKDNTNTNLQVFVDFLDKIFPPAEPE